MIHDFWLVIRFWAAIFLCGSAAYPVTRYLFAHWYDRGYAFSKAIGLLLVTWIVYALGTVRILPFSFVSIGLSVGVLFVIGIGRSFVVGMFHDARNRFPSRPNRSAQINSRIPWRTILLEECLFLGALLFWSYIKAHEPSIRGLEKFMDYGFVQSILTHPYFPSPDMWYAGSTINYYYFGHIALALLTKLSGIELSATFNLMLSSLFAFTVSMSFAIGVQIAQRKKIVTGMLAAFFVALTGNMQTLYAFTRGYTGDRVQPFWELLWPANEFMARLPEGLQTYWYANATRFIPFTIHEFPSYSFVVSDVHGHVLSLPFVLLAVALVFEIFHKDSVVSEVKLLRYKCIFTLPILKIMFYGFLVGCLLMTNALDGPIYGSLFVVLFVIHIIKRKAYSITSIGMLILFGLSALVAAFPFLTHFQSFVHGIAVNCPPAFLSNMKYGPVLFEGVEKCQKSPLWMMAILWGFFIYSGLWLSIKMFVLNGAKQTHHDDRKIESLLLTLCIFSIGLIIFPEFLYFKDIYPQHFRSNTMFKLGYQAFIMFSIMSAYTIVHLTSGAYKKIVKRVFILLLIPQVFLISIYPLFSVRSYFDSLRQYHGLDGLEWLKTEYPDDVAAMNFIQSRRGVGCGDRTRSLIGSVCEDAPVVVEADGDSYTDYNHVSAFGGFQTIVGWAVHEWLWRGSYDVVAPRREDVRKIYESPSLAQTEAIIRKYHVSYILVGPLERKKFIGMQIRKLNQLGTVVFTSGSTVVYQVRQGESDISY